MLADMTLALMGAAMKPETKLSKLKAAAADGNWAEALGVAAKFPDLGADKAAITRAHGCITNPRFFAQLGIDCAAAVEAGKRALRSRYGL